MVKYDEKHTKRKRNIIREGNIEKIFEELYEK